MRLLNSNTTEATVDVYKESDPEPARKQIASRRVVKNKVTITVDDNIVPEPDVALELGKSISLTEAAEEEAARQVHATHARIVIELVPKPTRRRPSVESAAKTCVCEAEVAGSSPGPWYVYLSTYQRPAGEGSNKETSVSPGVPDKSIVVLATSSKGTSTKPGVLDEEKVTSKANVILEWGSEQESEYSEEEDNDDDDDEMIEWVDMDEEEEKKDDDDDKSIDLEQTGDEETDDEFVHGEEHVQDDDEETDDEFVHGDEYVNEDEDEEMTNAEVEESGNGDEEVTDATKVDAGKTEEVKDDSKKAELPSTSSNLLVSSGFGDQFLKLSSDTSLISNVKDTTDAEINSLLDIKIQYEVPYIQFPFVLTVPILVISEPSVLTPIPETSSVAPTTNILPPSSVSTIPHLRVAKLAKGMSELKKMDHSTEALATLKSQVPTIFEHYLGSKIELHLDWSLGEICGGRGDRGYKFKEGDFVDLHLNDIKDMLLLAVQHKLFQLDGSEIVDLIVALCMFTRSLIIKRRVEDL
ncbi:hypothetical protein Tco_0336653 [Tanacetum coccineum]